MEMLEIIKGKVLSPEQSRELIEVYGINMSDAWLYFYQGNADDLNIKDDFYDDFGFDKIGGDIPTYTLEDILKKFPKSITEGDIEHDLIINMQESEIQYYSIGMDHYLKSLKNDNMIQAAFEMLKWLKSKDLIQ